MMWTSPAVLWTGVGLLLAAGTATAGALVRDAVAGAVPPAVPSSPQRAADRAGPIALAGSGGNLPLTRALAEAFEARTPGARLVVQESIGSTGGVRAVAEGAIDVGLVSRSLRAAERGLGLETIPYARVAVVLATHPGVSDHGLTRADVLAVYDGRKR